jgi:hypothetical protein
MRQIRVGAWLLVMCMTAAACSGEKFTAKDEGTAARDDDADDSSAPPSRNEGASGGDDAGESPPSSGAGKSLGGGASTGGAFSAAGTGPSSGGADNRGGDSPGNTTGDCSMGTLKFKMVPSPDLPKDYLCDAGCGTGWLTITDQQGAAAYSLFAGCGSNSCESCSPLPCAAAACLPTPLTAQGSELTWAGTYLTEDTCGAYEVCQRPACVQPGKYKAKACAAVNGGANDMAGGSCTPKSMQLCAEAEFEFPGASEVELVLKQPY